MIVQVCGGVIVGTIWTSSHNYFCHFHVTVTPWMPSRRERLKVCAVISIYTSSAHNKESCWREIREAVRVWRQTFHFAFHRGHSEQLEILRLKTWSDWSRLSYNLKPTHGLLHRTIWIRHPWKLFGKGEAFWKKIPVTWLNEPLNQFNEPASGASW